MQNVLLFDLGDIVRADLKLHCDSLRALGFASRLQMCLLQRKSGPSLSLIIIGNDKKKYQSVCSLIEDQGYSAPNFYKWEVKENIPFSLGDVEATNVWFLSRNNNKQLDPAIKLWSIENKKIEMYDYSEFPRILREALYLPVPRPVSPDQRQGAILSLPAEINKQILYDSLFNDYSYEMITFENKIIAYTENTDIEDSLLMNAGVRRLSRAVYKTRLYSCKNDFMDEKYNDLIVGAKLSLVTIDTQLNPPACVPWTSGKMQYI